MGWWLCDDLGCSVVQMVSSKRGTAILSNHSGPLVMVATRIDYRFNCASDIAPNYPFQVPLSDLEPLAEANVYRFRTVPLKGQTRVIALSIRLTPAIILRSPDRRPRALPRLYTPLLPVRFNNDFSLIAHILFHLHLLTGPAMSMRNYGISDSCRLSLTAFAGTDRQMRTKGKGLRR
jgi:hypothetical protein